jgi:hypothetical protein
LLHGTTALAVMVCEVAFAHDVYFWKGKTTNVFGTSVLLLSRQIH